MKKISVWLLSVVMIAGCKDYKPEMERAVTERDSIMMISEAKDSSINTFLTTLNDIEANLDSITRSQESIALDTRNKVEFSKDIRDRINENIRMINELVEKNKELILSLNEKLRNSRINIASLKTMIEKLNSDIALKDAEITDLNARLSDMRLIADNLNHSIDSLHQQNKNNEAVIAEKISQLNTAWYAIGTYKELKTNNILTKEGGFLGLGKEKALKKDFNPDGFTRIDLTQIQTFEINNKTARVITNHPSDSYTLEKDKNTITSLKITDPLKFWKASKYLVIVTG